MSSQNTQRSITFIHESRQESPSITVKNGKRIETKKKDPKSYRVMEIHNSLEFKIGEWVEVSKVRDMCKSGTWYVTVTTDPVILNRGY
jgi:ribosomal protein S17